MPVVDLSSETILNKGWDLELERRLRLRYALPEQARVSAPSVQAGPAGTGSFITEIAGRVVFTGPATHLKYGFDLARELPLDISAKWQEQAQSNPYFKWVAGRFVGSGAPNENGASWTTGDLQFGHMGVKHGPLNWIHQSHKIIGSIADAHLTSGITDQFVGNQMAAAPIDPHITTLASVWEWIWPDESAVLDMASETGKLNLSMECVSEAVQCTGPNGCEQTFNYMDAQFGMACEHINTRSSTRRMVNPSFLGGAVVVPPAEPGWKEANAIVMSKAGPMAAEAASAALAGTGDSEWEMLMGSVVAYGLSLG